LPPKEVSVAAAGPPPVQSAIRQRFVTPFTLSAATVGLLSVVLVGRAVGLHGAWVAMVMAALLLFFNFESADSVLAKVGAILQHQAWQASEHLNLVSSRVARHLRANNREAWQLFPGVGVLGGLVTRLHVCHVDGCLERRPRCLRPAARTLCGRHQQQHRPDLLHRRRHVRHTHHGPLPCHPDGLARIHAYVSLFRVARASPVCRFARWCARGVVQFLPALADSAKGRMALAAVTAATSNAAQIACLNNMVVTVLAGRMAAVPMMRTTWRRQDGDPQERPAEVRDELPGRAYEPSFMPFLAGLGGTLAGLLGSVPVAMVIAHADTV